MTAKQQQLRWSVGWNAGATSMPDKRVPAAVPGAVQLDWAKAEGWGPHFYADNWQQYGWMEDVYWSYTAKLDFSALADDERLFFVSKGIDYRFAIRLNGETIHEQEGMFTPVELELTDRAIPGDELEVLVYPAPKRPGAPVGRDEADQSVKPAVSYGWDWHPRLIPLGIWDETYLEVRPTLHLLDAEVSYRLEAGFSRADLTLEALLSEPGGRLVWTLTDRDGREALWQEASADAVNVRLTAALDRPELWWPNGHGDPVLYRSTVELFDAGGRSVDRRDSRIGFRTVRLVMYPGAWNHPNDFPKSRSYPPITLEVNGRSIFAKGSNWVNPDIFPGTMTEHTYRPLVQMAKDAHMNLLRIWGGGIVNKESFFDLCDEMGVMVWQEFPLACNNYVGTPEYLRVLDQESRSILKRVRRHASLAMWCGGNELFNGWSGMTDQSLALRLLNKNSYELDPETPFIMTSPLDGMAHGCYLFRYLDGRELYQVMPEANYTAYTEFGVPSPSPVEVLKTFMPDDQLFPPKPGTVWETHHAYGAWMGDTWLQQGVIDDYFGPSQTLEELVERGQLLQSEGYKCIYEESRRQKPMCSMALNWCYNEAWPTAANNSLICWPAVPKPSYYAVQASCRPVLASARISKYAWRAGEVFDPELWMLSDLPEAIDAGRLDAYLQIGDEELFLLSWQFPALEANKNAAGPVIRFPLPDADAERMTLVLRVPGKPEYDSSYTLVYRPSAGNGAVPKKRILNV